MIVVLIMWLIMGLIMWLIMWFIVGLIMGLIIGLPGAKDCQGKRRRIGKALPTCWFKHSQQIKSKVIEIDENHDISEKALLITETQIQNNFQYKFPPKPQKCFFSAVATYKTRFSPPMILKFMSLIMMRE